MSDTLRRSLILILVAAVAAGVYYWQRGRSMPGSTAPSSAPPAEVMAPPAPAPQPLIRHPVVSPAVDRPPLPPPGQSDAAVRERLIGLIGPHAAGALFNPHDYIKRIVVTVDNLTQRRLPQRYAPFKPVQGEFQAKQAGDGTQTISAENFARYTPYVHLAETVDVAKLAAVYAYFYPLFQRAYNDLGYRGRYFNDRVIEVIDNLLEAPDLDGPIRVTQPGVSYKYADPQLEGLSAGQKIMVRMGPYNAKQVKARLRELRQALVHLGSQQLGQ